MNRIRKGIAVLISLALLLGIACAELTTDYTQAALATVGDKTITWSEVEYMAYLLQYYGYAEDYDYNAAFERLISRAVIEDHIARAGLDQFEGEELAALQADAQAEWEEMLNDYVTYYLSEDTEEARASLREDAIAYYESNGYSLAEVEKEMIQDAASSKLEQILLDGYAPSEAEINALFEQYGAQYRAQYEGNVPMYELYTNYYGAESWYTPEGYRSVLNLLLGVEETVLSAYTDAQNALEEATSAETPDENDIAARKAELEQAEAAVLEATRETIDAVYAELQAGSSFQDVLAKYGTDPGMKDETNLAEGYRVHQDSILYDKAFVNAAFSEKMQAVGDVSDPQVGSYGIYILYYLSDVPGGLVLTEEIRTQIAEYLTDLRVNENYAAQYDGWAAEAGLVRNDEAFEAAKAAALAAAAAQEQTEPEQTEPELTAPDQQ